MRDALADTVRAPAGGNPADDRGRHGVLLAAVVAIVGAEAVVAFVDPVAGAVVHAALLLALLLRWVTAGDLALLVLALVPLGRVTSLALTPDVAGPGAYLLTGLPLLVAVVWTARGLGAHRELRWGRPAWIAIAVALCGIPLGLLVDAVLDLPGATGGTAAGTAVVVFVFAGALEELLFRGLVQRALTGPFGVWGVVLADLLFSAAYLPTRDVGLVAVMAVAGLGAGFYVRRTGGVAAVAIAHGLLAAGALAVWPALG
ncbi:MAG: putative metal-dependent rane protease [Modestobacter sp.]|jgi:membrane protease YdiL (CAAX protease family)|nr:putative metal-dependent rane protease [Modestobacter sp.]